MIGIEVLPEYLEKYRKIAGVEFLVPSFEQLVGKGVLTKFQIPDGNLAQPSLSALMSVRGIQDREFLATLTIDPQRCSTQLTVRVVRNMDGAPFNVVFDNHHPSGRPVYVACNANREGELEVRFRRNDIQAGDLGQGQLSMLYEDVVERVCHQMFTAGYRRVFSAGNGRNPDGSFPSDWTLRAVLLAPVIK